MMKKLIVLMLLLSFVFAGAINKALILYYVDKHEIYPAWGKFDRPDMEYTYYCLSMNRDLGREMTEKHQGDLARFVYELQQPSGGYLDPGRIKHTTDMKTTYFATQVLKDLGKEKLANFELMAQYMDKNYDNSTGAFNSNIADTYYAVKAAENIGVPVNKAKIAMFTLYLEDVLRGGYGASLVDKAPTLESTYFALSLLNDFNLTHSHVNRNRTFGYLKSVAPGMDDYSGMHQYVSSLSYIGMLDNVNTTAIIDNYYNKITSYNIDRDYYIISVLKVLGVDTRTLPSDETKVPKTFLESMTYGTYDLASAVWGKILNVDNLGVIFVIFVVFTLSIIGMNEQMLRERLEEIDKKVK